MTDEPHTVKKTAVPQSPYQQMTPVNKVLLWAVALLVVAAAIALVTYLGWDRGGWVDSDDQVVEAEPVPWGGFILAAVPSLVGSAFLAVGVIAKGVQLGHDASSPRA